MPIKTTSIGNLTTVATDSTRVLEGTRFVVPDQKWVERMHAIKTILMDRGLDPDLVLNVKVCKKTDQQIEAVNTSFITPEVFNLETKAVETYNPMIGFTNENHMPLHVLVNPILINGGTMKTKLLEELHEAWRELVCYTLHVTGEDTAMAMKILLEVLKIQEGHQERLKDV